MRRIVVCGPPHSGKSVFLSNLQRLLPVEHHMLIFGAPDGEWHWSNESDQNMVRELRHKGQFTDDFYDNIVSAITCAEQRLVLVDTGGRRTDANARIFSVCDAFIIVSSSQEEMAEWRKFGEAQGCKCIAELDSVLHGACELYPEAEDKIIRGRISGLERGQTVKSPVLDAVAKRLCEVIAANAEMTEAELLANINGAKLVDHLGITDRSDPYLGVRPWHTAPALKLTGVARKLETVRIWNVRTSFLSCAFATALPCVVELFGVSEGYVRLPEVEPQGNGSGSLEWEVSEFPEYTLVEYRKKGFFTKDLLEAIIPPIVNPRKGVVLSTDGPPIWLDATIARSYAKAGIPWIAIFVPVESGRVQLSLNGQRWDEVYPKAGPCVVIHSEKERLGEIIPVPISLLKWNGGGRRWQIGSGEVVIDRPDSHVATHPTVLPILGDALARIHSDGSEYIIKEVNFDQVIGEMICVETREGDEIVFAQRPNRAGLTRFVKNREAEPCSVVTVCLKKDWQKNCYVLLTAFVGNRAPVEPWDTRWATEESFIFWNSHALVWGKEEIIPGTETEKCSW